MASAGNDEFYVGYLNAVPKRLGVFLVVAVSVMLGGLAGLALAVAANVDDAGDGHFASALGPQAFTGVLQADPYPVLRVFPSEAYPQGRAITLVGKGKRGVLKEAAALDGQVVDAGGIFIKRGSIEMLRISGDIGLRASEAELTDAQKAGTAPAAEPLGRWRLVGEVCDGKCYAGAMRPGRGLAHKACANLCLIGGAPPVFVSETPVEGSNFLLLAGPDGGPLPESFYDYVALLVTLDGEVERRDHLLVFKVDITSATVL